MNCKFCEKLCKNSNSLRNHERLCKSNVNRQNSNSSIPTLAASKKISCSHCSKLFSIGNINKHIQVCKFDSRNLNKKCPVCEKMYRSKAATCSKSCANSHFRSGENHPNWNPDSYRSTCFLYHEKKCIVCNEDKIVAVHHLNENHNDNRPENLIPLCPTHHSYVHSNYYHLVKDQIDRYVQKFNSEIGKVW